MKKPNHDHSGKDEHIVKIGASNSDSVDKNFKSRDFHIRRARR